MENLDNSIISSNPEVSWKDNFHNLIFAKFSLIGEIKKVYYGLKQPKDTGSYVYARQQVVRLWAPVFAILFPILIAFIVILQPNEVPKELPTVSVMMEPEPEKPLDEIKQIDEKIEPPEITDQPITESTKDGPAGGPDIDAPNPGTDSNFSPSPAKFDSVAIIKSPISMKGIYGSRTPGARGGALRGYGGGSATEAAVYRVLRWLKKNQEGDGSWKTTKPAMTSLALLVFLAHGETPASEEFGTTVEMAIKFLIDNQTEAGRFNGSDGHEYALPIAAYALSEAYGLTKIPDVKAAAEKAVYLIVEGQNAKGGWNYNLEKVSGRNDTSYDGWCCQALKAAKMANLDIAGLEEAEKKAINGLKANYAGTYEKGGFGYCGPEIGNLTPVGVLCSQLLGGSKTDQVKGGLKFLEDKRWDFNLEKPSEQLGKNALYYWYYATQAKFHVGGETWNKWNKQFSPNLVKTQHIIPKDQSGYVDHKGKPQEIGFWDQFEGHGFNEGAIFATTLCVLQLEVYYRYLPSFKVQKEEDKEVKKVTPKKDGEVKIDVSGS
jgi:hypothetical protein